MTQEHFKEHGIVFPLPVMNQQEVNRILSGLFAYVSNMKASGKDSLDASPFDGVHHPLVQLLMPVVRNRKFLNAVRPYLGNDILLRSINVFSKAPTGVGGINPTGPSERGKRYPIQWHWDDPRPGSETDDVLTAWIALTPSTVSSGCVRYVEKSHKVEIHRDNPEDRNQLQLLDGEWSLLEGLPIVDAVLKPGEMALHHSAVVHGSAPNFAERPRVGLAVRLYTPRSPEKVTGTRIGVLLSGHVPQAEDSQSTEGLQLRDVVNMSWWRGRKSNPQQGVQTPQFSRQEAHEKFLANLEERVADGEGEAAYLLGRIRLVGMCDTSSEPAEAVRLFSLGAERGEPRALAFQEECEEEEEAQVLQVLREESKGLSTLAWCCYMGDEQSAALLLEEGLPVNLRMRDGRQAIHVAASQGSLSLLELLLGHGADPESVGSGGETPLHIASRCDHEGWVEALLGRGVDDTLVDNSGKTPGENAPSDAMKSLFTREAKSPS